MIKIENKDYPVNKNDEYIVDIIDYGTDGEGIAKINGYTIFVIGAMKGEKCKIHILKTLTTHAFAKVEEVIQKSPKRVIPDCVTYNRCGGCSMRHISYAETLNIKREKVQNLVNKFLTENKESNNNIIVDKTIGMDSPFYYRNKAIYPVCINKDGKPQVGIFAKMSHEVIPFDECKIQTKISQEISKYIVDNWSDSIYDEATGKGLLRNIMIRDGFATGEIMVVLVQNGTKKYDYKNLIEKFPQIKTIIINVNTKNTNVVLSKENIILYGDGTISDKLGKYEFKISANSFYQVNSLQTEKLYNLAIEKAKLDKNDILCDLYCGIGTIGIFASEYVKKVYGIEIVPEAINDAKQNAKLNNIENADFIVGDVEQAFTKLINKNIRPNVVIVDPPRKGLDDNTVKNLCNLKLDRLVYVSCNPATLMRDLKKLKEVYKIKSITPVDNFCYSSHIECVVSLEIEKIKKEKK